MKNVSRGQSNGPKRIFHREASAKWPPVFIFTLGLIILSFSLGAFRSLAAPNLQINYQGKLTNSSSVTVADGNYIMKFRLYTTASSATTTNIWEEIRTATGDLAAVTSGLFSVMLGSTTPLTSVNFNQTLYLGVEVCGTSSLAGCDGEMTPRKVLGASPAAFVSTYVSGSSTPSSFGTTTSLTNTQVTIEATTTTAIPLTIRGAASQSANLFNVQNSAVSPLFFINATGGVFASSTLQVTGAALLYSDLTVNGSLLVNNATSTITNLTMVNATSTNSTSTNQYSSSLVASNATTTNFAVFTNARFGGTATSTFNSSGDLLVVGSTTLQNFTGRNATTTNATTTTLYVSGLSTLTGGLFINSATSTITNLTMVNSTTTKLVVNSTTATSTFSTGGLTVGTSQFIVQQTSGFVGIGTTTPSDKLTLYDGSFRQAPGNPVTVGSVALGSNYQDIAVAGRYGYAVSVTDDVLKVIDLYAPDGPTFIGTPLALGSVTGGKMRIIVAGRYAYVTDASRGLQIIDISDPSSLSVVSVLSFSRLTDIAVAGRYAYLVNETDTPGDGGSSFYVVDISNPAAPVLLSTFALNAAPSEPLSLVPVTNVYVLGRYAYVADPYSDNFKIINISNPSAPSLAGSSNLSLSSALSRLTVSGRFAYFVDSTNSRMQIIDVATSSEPISFSTSLTLDSGVSALAVAGRYGYVVSTADTIKTIDLVSSTTPVVVGSTSVSIVSGAAIAVAGRYAYVVDDTSGTGKLTVFDLTGLEVATGMIHSLEAGSLQVRQNSAFDQNLSIRGGLNIGSGGLYVSGPLAVGPSSLSQGSATTSAYFQGAVGVASTSPWGLLSVEMNTTNPAFVVANQGSTTPAFWIGGVNQDGNIGIGTTTLNTTFNVQGNWRGDSYIDAGAYTSDQTVTVSKKALVYHLTNNSGTTNNGSITAITYNITGLPNVEGAFAYIYTFAQKGLTSTVDGFAGGSSVAIQINGTQVSTVSTPTQTAASQIFEAYVIAYSNGAWHIFGAPSTTNLADLAEWIEFDQAGSPRFGEAGELVSFGSQPVSVKRSPMAYDPDLAGIISTNPHTVMGAETPTSVMLSLAGRVPVKVSNENGPIQIGDYLTSSSIPGVAMRATKAGRVVGRALEAFEGDGVGMVTALVEPDDWPGPNLAEILAGLASSTVSLDARLNDLEVGQARLAALETAPPIASAGQSFLDNLFEKIMSWLANAANGIREMFADTFRAKEKVCIGATCLDETTLKALLKNISAQGGPAPGWQPEPPPPVPIPVESVIEEPIEEPLVILTAETSTPPVIIEERPPDSKEDVP